MNRATGTLLAASSLGAVLIAWPLFASANAVSTWKSIGAPALIAIVVPIMLGLAINETLQSSFNTKQLAVIAVLIAVAVAVRPLGAGVAGIEPIWIVVIIAGRALGAQSGFIIGSGAIAASALLTGSVGPWLPYQMVVAAWIGCCAGLLPRTSGVTELLLLGAFTFVATFAFGWLMNLWFWATASGLTPEISFDATSSPLQRVTAWARFSLVTSFGFDLPRAVFSTVGVVFAAQPLLNAIRRANRRATIAISKP